MSNKTEQLARYLLAKGKMMSAQEIYHGGFRFEGDKETTVTDIMPLINKIHLSACYQVERKINPVSKVVNIRVLAIEERKPVVGKNVYEQPPRIRALWHTILTRPTAMGQSAI